MTSPSMDDDFQDVSGSSWFKFEKTGDAVQGIFIEWFTKEATDDFGEQTVAVLETETGTVNVGLPASNPRYDGAIRKLKVGHDTKISLTGFFNQDTQQISQEAGKTKKGRSFAKNYSIQQKPTPAPVKEAIDLADLPF